MRLTSQLFFSSMLLISSFLVACGEAQNVVTDNLSAVTQTQAPPPGDFGGRPPGGPRMPGGPGGLPPNFEQIQADYPELAAALEAMQDLTPEERFTQMEALFAEHPEWRQALMPPGGMRPPGNMPPPPATQSEETNS